MSPTTIIEVVGTPPARSAPTAIDAAFMVGFSEKGPLDRAVTVTSIGGFEAQLGPRVTATPWLYDAADCFFREGGARLHVAREVGPAPVKASLTLQDSVPADTLKVEALTPGIGGNRISVEVTVQSSNFTLNVYVDDVLKETFPGLADRAAATAVVSNLVAVSLTGASSNDPAALAKTALTGGADDHANATTTQLSASLALFVADLGPGMVLAPGVTDSAAQALIAQHAFEHDRMAFLDAPDTPTLATIEAAASAIRNGNYARTAAMFAPWLVVPGPLQGQERVVSPAAVAAGLVARSVNAGNPPDVPAANTNGDSVAARDLNVATWADQDRDELNVAGADAFKDRRGTITLWGYRTLYDPDTDEKWVPLGAALALMQIIAEVRATAEQFVLRRMDGKRHLLVELRTALAGPLDRHVRAGSLEFEFDDDGSPIPGTAYSIQTGWDPDERELSADLTLRLTDMVETVRVRIIRRATGEAL